jgi:hypothetical protein
VEQVKASLSAPAIVVEKLPLSEEDPDAGAPKPEVARVTKWIYAGLAALILLTVILAAVVRNTVVHNNASVPVATPVAAAAQQDEPAPATATPPALPGQRKTAGWSVIVGAYRSRELAEKRMREMTNRWPNFQISVFESQEEKTPYLLILGRNLSEDQAQALRQRAFKSRLPGDTYIKRVM